MDRQILYKSRSVRDRRAEDKKAKYVNRSKQRDELRNAHRDISVMNKSEIKTPATVGRKANKSPGHRNDNNNNKRRSSLKNVVKSKQQQYQERFLLYKLEKDKKKQKQINKKPLFYNVVPIGRFLSANEDVTTNVKLLPKETNKKEQHAMNNMHQLVNKKSDMKLNTNKKEMNKISPPRTRSKNPKLLSPLPLMVVRSKRKSNNKSLLSVIDDELLNVISKPVTPKIKNNVDRNKFVFSNGKNPMLITSTIQKSNSKNGPLLDTIKPNAAIDLFDNISPIDISSPTNSIVKNHELPKKEDNEANEIALTETDKTLSPPQEPSHPRNATPISDNKQSPINPTNYVSPFVAVSRGKVSAKKEKQVRNSIYTLTYQNSPELSIERRQDREAAEYFKNQLNMETERLLKLVNDWENCKNENLLILPNDIGDMIDVIIGQTRLLTTEKFDQFRRLINQCYDGRGFQKVHANDLEGFWAMIYIQVEKCDQEFNKLDKLKSDNWIVANNNVDKKMKPEKKHRRRRRSSQPGVPHFLNLIRKIEDAKKTNTKMINNIDDGKDNGNEVSTSVLSGPSVKDSPKIIRRKSSRKLTLNSPAPTVTFVSNSENIQAGILKTPGTTRKSRRVVFSDINGSSNVSPDNTDNINVKKKFIGTPMVTKHNESVHDSIITTPKNRNRSPRLLNRLTLTNEQV